MKHLKWLSAAVVLLCVFCGVWFGVVQYNTDAISNARHGRKVVKNTADTVLWDGWTFDADGNATAQTNDATMTVTFDEETEVHDLLLAGSMSRVPGAMRVTVVGADGTEQTETVKGKKQNDDYLLKVDRSAVRLVIQPFETAGETLTLKALTANPRTFHFEALILLASLAGAAVLLVVIDCVADRAGVAREFRAMIRYRHLIFDLVGRDVKTKYRRSVLGLLWSVLHPLLMMLVLTAVFSTIFHYKAGDFSVYYLTGYLLFNFVTEATVFSMASIIGAAGLIKKVYIPKFVFPLEKCLFALVNFLFSLIAAVIVFLAVGVQPHWTILLFPIPVFCLFLFNFGISLILAALNTFFRDVGYLYNVFVTIWMYLTPIIYPVEILPAWILPVVKLNPLYHFVQYFRNVTLYGTVPSLRENLICILFALLFLLVGLLFFRKKQDKFIFYI